MVDQSDGLVVAKFESWYLEPQARDPATLQHRRGVTELAVFDRRRADERPSAASSSAPPRQQDMWPAASA
jgi:hypothetical protein